MEQTAAAALWVLITVTNAAAVHQESGFSSQALCEDAISIAQYGKTVAEHKEDVRQRDEARRLRNEKWRAEHPPREPETSDEKEQAKHSSSWQGSGGCGHIKDGLIYEDQCEGGWTMTGTYNRDNEIKFARCLPDPGSAK